MGTRVEWADETLSPWAGCTKISEGCMHCTALSFARRLQGTKHPKYDGTTKDGEWTGRVNFDPNELDKLYSWRKPRRVFIQIMGDIAHENVGRFDFLAVMESIRKNPRHTCMLLTKRPLALMKLLNYYYDKLYHPIQTPLPNVWVGVTVENQEQADKRIPVLLQIPAAKRFISFEPLLEQIRLNASLDAIDQAIVGAETGPGKRPMYPGWAYDIFNDCLVTGTAFFGKKNSNGNPLLIKGKAHREFAK